MSKRNPQPPTAELLQRVGRLLANDQQQGDLNPVQWEALRFFARANRFSRSPSALTAYLGVTKGTVSQTIKALERKGLVRKQPLATDRRAVSIHLTAAGQQRLRDDPLAAVERVLGQMPRGSEGLLREQLQALLKDLLAERQQQPFGQCRTCRHFQKRHKEGNPHRCGLLLVPLSADDASQICEEHDWPEQAAIS